MALLKSGAWIVVVTLCHILIILLLNSPATKATSPDPMCHAAWHPRPRRRWRPLPSPYMSRHCQNHIIQHTLFTYHLHFKNTNSTLTHNPYFNHKTPSKCLPAQSTSRTLASPQVRRKLRTSSLSGKKFVPTTHI